MEAEWLRDERERFLARALRPEGLTRRQHETVVEMDREWARCGMSLATRGKYARDARRLSKALQKPFEEATRADLERYLDALQEKHAPATIAATKRFLKTFYKKLLRHEQPGHPTLVSWIRNGRLQFMNKRPQDLLTKEEVLRLARGAANHRDRAIIMVLYESAARAGELLSLRLADVELDQYGARLTLRGKTGLRKVRIIDSVFDLAQWMNLHPTAHDANQPLFVSFGHQSKHRPLTRSGLSNLLDQAKATTQLRKRVHPHLLRHSRLTALAKDLSESELKVFAGWTADSLMAKVYVHLSGDDVDRKLLEKAGLLTKEVDQRKGDLRARRCPRCNEGNSPVADYCAKCTMPLDEERRIALMEEDERLRENLPRLLKLLEDPRLVEILRKPASEGPALPSTQWYVPAVRNSANQNSR